MQWNRVRSGLFLVRTGLWVSVFLVTHFAVADTVFTNNTTIAAGEMAYEGSNIVVMGCTLTVEGEHTFAGLTVTNAGAVTADTTLNLASLVLDASTFTLAGGSTLEVSGAITLSHTSTLTVQGIHTATQVEGAWAGAGGGIQAGSVTIPLGSQISADMQGYAGGSGLESPGRGPGGGEFNNGCAGGGGHGGMGGTYYVGTGGVAYGSAAMPTNLGSGGASDDASRTGGRGGGAIRLWVDGTLSLDGTISANGQTRTVPSEGAGAGGSLWVTAHTLTGSGVFQADGGAQTYGKYADGGGGGGGRIAVYSENDTGYSGFTTSTASGGEGYSSSDGRTGTAAFFDTSVLHDHVNVYQRFELAAGSNRVGAISLNHAGTMSVGTGSVLVVDGAMTLDGGSTFRFGGGSSLSVGETLSLSNMSTFLAQSIHTDAQVASNWAGQGVTVSASHLIVESGSQISADLQGYAGGSGLDSPGRGPGGGEFNNGCAGGGGHGGLGGTYYVGTGGVAYGSATMPTNLGSGGASDDASRTGGRGGGAIRLWVDGTLSLDGTISANGQTRTVPSEGAGAGGSLWVTAHTLTGSGVFQADGGTQTYGKYADGGGGGGGRIAVYSENDTGYSGFTTSTVSGGEGYSSSDGRTGTAAFFDTSVSNRHLTVVQNFAPVAGDTRYGALTLLDGATMTVGEDPTLTVDGTLWLNGSSTLRVLGRNTSAPVEGEWAGQGVTVRAGHMTVEADSTLHADASGYTGKSQSPGNGPGAGEVSASAAGGAGHGGLGGDGGSSTLGGSTYGSANRPVHPGSGGGGGTSSLSTTVGGTGGGALRLIVDGTLALDGTISANGSGTSQAYCSGGSGGSIWVDANDLSGTGSLLANGGNGGDQAGGGGGGRIAVYYWSSLSWPTGNVSVLGGSGYRSGASGEAVVAQEEGDHWWDRSDIVDATYTDGSFAFDVDCPTAGWSNIVERCTDLRLPQQWNRIDGFVTTEPDVHLVPVESNGVRRVYYRLRGVSLE